MSLPAVSIRRVRAVDRQAMLEMTRDVWEGSDYVPLVWDDWLSDNRGTVMVAVVADRVVGLQHVDLHPDGCAWLEGIRVASDLQGRGIGRKLVLHGIQWAREAGSSAVRLATSVQNVSSNRMAESAGFREIGAFQQVRAEVEAGDTSMDTRIAAPSEFDSIWSCIQKSNRRYYTEGWTAYRLTPGRLRMLLATHAVVVARSGAAHALTIATSGPRRPVLRVGLLAGEWGAVRELGRWLRQSAAAARLDSIRGPLHIDDEVSGPLVAAGFSVTTQHAMVLRELVLAV